MNDAQGNGFVLTAEDSLERGIVKVRKEGGFAGTTLPSKITSSQSANLNLPKGKSAGVVVSSCKLTNIDG